MRFPGCCLVRVRTLLTAMLFFQLLLPPPVDAQRSNGEKTYRLAAFGNSLTKTIRLPVLAEIVGARGQKLETGMVGIAGTPLDYLWNHKKEEIVTLLARGDWDGMSLQPFLRPISSDLPMVKKFVNEAVKRSPDITTYIYAQYVHDMGYDYQELWRQDVQEYVEQGTGQGLVSPMRTRGYYEALTRGAREEMPDRKIFLVPVGHAFALLDEKIKAGRVPGVKTLFEMWADRTHVNNFGSFLTGMIYYAVLFNESPVGLPVGGYQGRTGEWHITDEQARILQQTAWEVAASHPLAGVRGVTEPVKIVTPGIYPTAIAGEPFRKELTAAFGRHPYSWTLSDGRLPGGLTVERSGVIMGTPAETGDFKFELTVKDATGDSDTQTYELDAEEDLRPRIVSTQADLGTYAAGETIKIRLQAEGGNGDLKWSATVPDEFTSANHFGLQMRADGLLSGSVGRPGTYAFTAQVEDGDITRPESVEQPYRITITEPAGEVLGAYRVPDDAITPLWKLRRNHKNYRKMFWDQFDFTRHPLTKSVRGSGSDNQADFQVFYTGDGGRGDLHIVVTVRDGDVLVNKQDLSEGDSIEVYLDILNNRQKIYNADDRRFIFAPDGTMRGSPNIEHSTVREYADGYYAVHISLPPHRLKRHLDSYVVMGLDIAVNDKDSADGPVSTLMWHGDGLHEEDTSGFGTIILIPREPTEESGPAGHDSAR